MYIYILWIGEFGGTEEQIKGPSFFPDTRDRDSLEINLLVKWFKLEQEFYFSSFCFLNFLYLTLRKAK
jgi:hypothetical protein